MQFISRDIEWCLSRSTHVELDDVLLFLPEHQARDAMEAFDGDADGHISAEVPQAHVLNTFLLVVQSRVYS